MIKKHLIPLALTLVGIGAIPALADDYERQRDFGQALCGKALSGIFPRLDLADVIAASQEDAGDICACTGELYASAGPDAHRAVMSDMQSGLLRHAGFDEHIATNMRSCQGEEEGFGLGEAFISHVLQCEGVVMGDDDLAGLDLKSFRARMRRDGLDAESICGCSGDYYLQHHEEITAAVLAGEEGATSYDGHMANSLQQCLDLGGQWPEVTSDPAFDADMDAEGFCHAVLMKSIEPDAFDYEAQSLWEQGSGLGAEELCGCVSPRSLDALSEADAADDLNLLEIVLNEIPGCRNNIWSP